MMISSETLRWLLAAVLAVSALAAACCVIAAVPWLARPSARDCGSRTRQPLATS